MLWCVCVCVCVYVYVSWNSQSLRCAVGLHGYLLIVFCTKCCDALVSTPPLYGSSWPQIQTWWQAIMKDFIIHLIFVVWWFEVADRIQRIYWLVVPLHTSEELFCRIGSTVCELHTFTLYGQFAFISNCILNIFIFNRTAFCYGYDAREFTSHSISVCV